MIDFSNTLLKKEKGFTYVDYGSGETLVFIHGLFGTINNWEFVSKAFSEKYRVLIPLLPLYSRSKYETSIFGLADFILDFLDYKGIQECTLIGNSLGGSPVILLAHRYPERFKAMVLAGSSGLTLPSSLKTHRERFFKRNDYSFIKKNVEMTFYDPKFADKELVDRVYKLIRNPIKAIRVIRFGRSGTKHHLRDELRKIKIPTLLIWGENDKMTPKNLALEFHELIENSELVFIDKCGHVPMIEHPETFGQLLKTFLEKHFVNV